eukprot:2002339-Rhodomonas_salina.2
MSGPAEAYETRASCGTSIAFLPYQWLQTAAPYQDISTATIMQYRTSDNISFARTRHPFSSRDDY